MEIIGKRPYNFTPADGNKVEGMNLFLTEPMTTPGAEGMSAERIFVSKHKLAALDFVPSVGQHVDVLYNRYGKVVTLKLIGDQDVDFG